MSIVMESHEINGIRHVLPSHEALYYGGNWHAPLSNEFVDVVSPATQEWLGRVAWAGAADVDRAVAAAESGYRIWKEVVPRERAAILREMASIVRTHGRELALLDAADGGNPVAEMAGDAATAAAMLEYFAGLVTEMKGASVPAGPGSVNFSVREPLGVVGRIIPFNHPFMFCAGKSAAPLAAGNSVIVKAPDQTPLSAIRLAELVGHLLPPGVFNVLTGGREAGAALASHPGVAAVAVIGSVPTGIAVMKAAADTLKPLLLELGGKNPLIALADADPAVVAKAAIDGMNFTWCGQSCGSTSRAFVHRDIYEAVLKLVPASAARFKPGLPTRADTTMGAIVSQAQFDRVRRYIELGRSDGARLVCGGVSPTDSELSKGYFVEPTVFADVRHDMAIAREEIFGPVLSIIPWDDEDAMIAQVNSVPYGLTASIWTDDLQAAHRLAQRVESGFIWINETSKHFLGTPFGGYKLSGLGREEGIEELLSFSREKHVHINLRARAGGK